jgi:hypothetical protein
MAQLSKKFIKDNAVGAAKIRLENDSYLKARNFADSGDNNILKSNASDRIEFASVPQSTSDALAANDLVRYSQFAGLGKAKEAVATVALADIDLAVAADPNPVSGHSMATGARILLAGQTASEENGIYVAVDETDPTTWIRATDYDAVTEIPGTFTVVQFGSEAGEVYLTTSTPAVIDVNAILFIKKAASSSLNVKEYTKDLDGTDITNQYIDLPFAVQGASASDNSVSLFVLGGGTQLKGTDYSVSLTGGVAGVTRISFLNDLATAGVSELDATDFVIVHYSHV